MYFIIEIIDKLINMINGSNDHKNHPIKTKQSSYDVYNKYIQKLPKETVNKKTIQRTYKHIEVESVPEDVDT